jgi:hypothetical protein
VSRRVRRPRRRKSPRQKKAVSKVTRKKEKNPLRERLKQISEEKKQITDFIKSTPGSTLIGSPHMLEFSKLTKLEKESQRLRKKLGLKAKKTTRPKQQLTPAQRRAVLAERELAPGKRRKRAALKKAREDLPPSFVDEGFEMFSVGSSNLSAVGYKERLKIMRVHFIGGNVYDYFGVPEFVYLSILEQGTSKGGAGSAGKALHQQVKVFTPQYEKTIYTYRKVR